MLKKVLNRVKMIRTGLINLNNQPIGKAVLTIVLFLDLFILISIFQGLSDHTSQLATPYEFIPQHCRDIVIDEDWNEDNRLVKTAIIATRSRNSYRYINGKNWLKDAHPICLPIIEMLRAIEKNTTLTGDLNTFLRNRNQSDQVKLEIERSRSAYDTSLLEVIADENNGIENTKSLKKQVRTLTEKLNVLASEEANYVSVFMQDEQIIQLFRLIETSPKENREVLLEELRNLNFWYPVKRLGMELLFLLPLIIIFFLWNSKSITASRPYQSLVSSHLLVVVFIPVVFKLLELVYDIMPKKILKYVIQLLESLNLVAIWHYLMMGAGIMAAMALIYFMQKKIFSPEKLMQKRITKCLCQNCGVHLPREDKSCSICGFKQYRNCSHCKKETYVNGKFCKECGCVE
ncbi:MAG: hypothetical protein ACI9T9_000598 [Oleiphilaceae bacterium]|jgi:hypothetical protein